MTRFSVSLDDLTASDDELLHLAREVASRAVNPVSGFYVGCAVRAGGQVYQGTFFESSSFPLGICAESAALSAAVTAGSLEITAVAVVGGDPQATQEARPVTPCGGCRQRIFDLTRNSGRDVQVLCGNLNLSKVLSLPIRDLLPFAFSADDLHTAMRRNLAP